MKKFLAAAGLVLAVATINSPLTAQKSRVRQPATIFVPQPVSPINYAEAAAYTDGRGVWIQWKTDSETKNLGFDVYRLSSGKKIRVNPAFITGADLQAAESKITAGNYSFYDAAGDANSAYLVESYHADGQRISSAPIQTQTIPDLQTVAGSSAEQFINQARDAKPVISASDSYLPKDLAQEVAALTSAPDPVRQKFVAAQPGARIVVKTEGFYRVSRTELQNAGFDVTAAPARWQLYTNGVEQAIDVAANGDYVEFYGKAANTLYSDTQTYYLFVGDSNGKRINSQIRRRVSGSVVSNSYSQYFLRKDHQTYLSDLLNGDAENIFGGTVLNATGATLTVGLSGVDTTASTASMTVSLLGLTYVEHQVKILLNDTEIGIVYGSNRTTMSGTFTFPAALLQEGTNNVRMLTLNSTPGGTADVALTDSIRVSYNRLYQATQNRLAFYVPNYKNSYAENFTSADIRVYDTTNADAPILLTGLTVEPSNGGYRVNLPSNRGRVLYAVENSGYLPAAAVTYNTPSTLSNTGHNADLVIISHKNFLPQAQNWMTYRNGQGFSGEVVNIEDVFDEFNYGNTCADCIRDFLNYAKTNWQTPPRYVLLIGDATFDPKNYFGANANFVPTRLVDTVYSEVGSDETMADFNDDGLAEIAIGRLPVRDGATVTLLLNKVMTFEQNVSQHPARGAFFASDLPDGYDFEGSTQRLAAQLPSSFPKTFVNRAEADAGTLVYNQVNSGKFLVNYTGHGNVGVWATTGFFGNSQAAQLSNGGNLSLFTMLTCLNGYFIQNPDSLAEILLKNPNGGAVATWASTGLTTPDIQEIMGTRFYNQVGAGQIPRLGDLIKDAKTTISQGRDVRLSWALLGDPMTIVR